MTRRAQKDTIAGYELRLKARQDKRDGLQKQLNAAGVQLDTLDSKIHMLREMEREYEGFSKAVRLVMQDAAAGKLRGIHGPVSKLIRVDDRYTTAIETALGAAMQNIVVSSEEDGKTAIQMLKRRDGGRATFLPLTTIKPQTLQDTVCQRQPGFLSIASGLVSCDEQYRAVIENALGRTVICDTLDNAVRMARACGSRVRIVTLDGQVMNAGGSMTGGSAAKSAGVLTRANTLAKLAEERKALTESAETLKAQTAEAASAAAKTEFELTAVRGQLREAEDEVLRRTEEHKQVQLLAAAVTENLENIEKELAHLTSRTGGEEGKLQTLKAQLQQQTSAQEALRAQETELTGDIDCPHRAAAAACRQNHCPSYGCGVYRSSARCFREHHCPASGAQRGDAGRCDTEDGTDSGIRITDICTRNAGAGENRRPDGLWRTARRGPADAEGSR